MKIKGFTLIELMIVIAILGIVAAIALPALSGRVHVDYICKGGYKFTHDGRQIIGANASGVPCDDVQVQSQPMPNKGLN